MEAKNEVLKSLFLGGYFDLGYYKSALKKMGKALDENKKIEYFQTDESKFGGILWLEIEGEKFQLSKKKLRQKDINFLMLGIDHFTGESCF